LMIVRLLDSPSGGETLTAASSCRAADTNLSVYTALQVHHGRQQLLILRLADAPSRG
jgi:hypothetical protein